MTALLAQWGLPVAETLTAGEAADVISLELLTRAERRRDLSRTH
jgi:hypothetical protein